MQLKNDEIRQLTRMSEGYADDNERATCITKNECEVIELRLHTTRFDLNLSLEDYPELKKTVLKLADWVTKTHNSRQMAIINKMEELIQCQKN